MIDLFPAMSVWSLGFLLLFLPPTLLFYWKVLGSVSHRRLLLLAASLLFYLLAAPTFLPLLVGLSLATFWLARKRWTRAGVVVNVLVLLFGKILASEIGSSLGGWLGIGGEAAMPLVLPLGLSFYTFKHISYLLDVRQGRHLPSVSFVRFLTYSAFFPQITAGPISSFSDTDGQMGKVPRKLDPGDCTRGLVHLSFGLAKKILVADILAAGAGEMLASPEAVHGGLGLAGAWLALVAFTLSLYFDFSGYTDMVLGVALLFGITLPANFNSPFRATDPREFWRRWHMSLVTWFRSYVFLAMSRSLIRRWGGARRALIQDLATMVTMVLLGLWHGVTVGWLLWGAYNGLLLIGHAWTRRRGLRIGSPILARSLLIISVLFGMALFTSADLGSLGELLVSLVGGHGLGFSAARELLSGQLLVTLLVASLVALSGVSEAAQLPELRRPAYVVALGVLAAICLMHLGTGVEVVYARF